MINKPKYDCHLKIHMHACLKTNEKCACQKGDGDVYYTSRWGRLTANQSQRQRRVFSVS